MYQYVQLLCSMYVSILVQEQLATALHKHLCVQVFIFSTYIELIKGVCLLSVTIGNS